MRMYNRVYAYIYSLNLHPQSSPFDLNTADVRAGESLMRLLVEIFQAQVHRWRGSGRDWLSSDFPIFRKSLQPILVGSSSFRLNKYNSFCAKSVKYAI